jgi:hypothetical protein
MATNGPLRPDSLWIARASTSLPAPLSPSRRIESFDIATRTSRGIGCSIAGTSVAIPTGREAREAASTTGAAPSGTLSLGSARKHVAPSVTTLVSSIAADVTRLPSTKVPLVEPTSSTRKAPSSITRRACLLDIRWSGISSVATLPSTCHVRESPRWKRTSRMPFSDTRIPPESGRMPSSTT